MSTERRNEVRAKYIDAWRGYSAVAVLVPHAIQVFLAPITGGDSALMAITGTLARYAVLVFFIISGYFITASILGNIQKNGTFRAGDYLIARVARIYPPLLFAVLLAMVLWALVQVFSLPGAEKYLYLPGAKEYLAREAFSLTITEVVSTVFLAEAISGIRMMAVNGPLWSLSIEFWLYMIAGLIATALTGGRRLAALATLALLCWMFFTHFALRNLFFSTFWMAGAIMALAESRSPTGARTCIRITALIGGGGLAAIGLAAATGVAPSSAFDATHNGTLSLLVQLLSAPILMAALYLNEPRRQHIFIQVGASIASYSYSLYILHLPLLLFLFSLAQATSVHVALTYSVKFAVVGLALAIWVCMAGARVAALRFEDSKHYQRRIRDLVTLFKSQSKAHV